MILYFFNFIPPVPLSLKEIGIYHDVTRESGVGYHVSYEPPNWFAFWEETNPVYHAQIGDPVYCFSSVFAPTGLSTPVSHIWQWLDPATNTWQEIATISFPIDGGRSAGYEGYSLILLPYAGEWRCNVETSSNQLIGRTTFSVSTSSAPVLKQKTI
jgi:hypothetical protein